ncbi:hypothetical protein PR202_gb18306 [Eleusine coracana subsp. coracana]|uniref:RING-type E3 ubiquitin transferase n=1 Tax=Eleusine coracana subsp. coracana TaxID=191504 RepID=A0AAV5F4J7_ELECO|nr:hypothetical protein PR202_gb18306 [Eleusine coracana subsp. coracana]
MPRRAPVPPLPLDDLFVEDVDYGESDQEGDDDQGSEEQEDEGSISSEGSESGSEEGEVDEGEGSDGEECEPPAGARVSQVAAAAERGNMPTCPVCMEAWTSEGSHRISCIPCGHAYGRSCLERWLTLRGNQSQSATCPQCGRRYRHKDIINLYAPEVAIPNNELEKVMHHGSLLVDLTKRLMDTEQRIIDAGSSKRQNELSLDGARVISIDASNHIILASGRAASVGGEHVLTKAPSWSCSADVSGSHHIYAGLQNGMLLTFDIRKSARPLHSMVGLSMHPIHTLHSVMDSNGSRKVLSASGLGPCMWDVDGNESRPNLLTGMENQRVCISLACAPPSSDLLVASFRPKVEASSEGDGSGSQVYLSQTPTQAGSGKLGHHSVIRRTGKASFAEGATCYGSVSEIRMSKSAIIPCGNNQHLLACGEESLRGVRTWQLPCFAVHGDLSPHRQAILDLRYAESPGGGRYLGCLSEEKLQVFRVR